MTVAVGVDHPVEEVGREVDEGEVGAGAKAAVRAGGDVAAAAPSGGLQKERRGDWEGRVTARLSGRGNSAERVAHVHLRE